MIDRSDTTGVMTFGIGLVLMLFADWWTKRHT